MKKFMQENGLIKHMNREDIEAILGKYNTTEELIKNIDIRCIEDRLGFDTTVPKKKPKKVINYPNRFNKYSTLPKSVKKILTDRGNKYQYRIGISAGGVTTITCVIPNGLTISGISFLNSKDTTNIDVGCKIAAGRLDAQLKYLTDLSQGYNF